MEVDFDPKVLTLRQLVELYAGLAHVRRRVGSVQYRNVVFYRSKEERELIDEILVAAGCFSAVDIERFSQFYMAEDYHQKYYLQESRVMPEFRRMFPNFWKFNDSSAAARANGFIGGFGSSPHMLAVLPKLGVSSDAAKYLSGLSSKSRFFCF